MDFIMDFKYPPKYNSTHILMPNASESKITELTESVDIKIKSFKIAHSMSKRLFYSASIFTAVLTFAASVISGYSAFNNNELGLTITVSVLSGLGVISTVVNSFTEAKTFIDFQNAKSKLESIKNSLVPEMTQTAFNTANAKYNELLKDTDRLRSSVFYIEI